MAEFMIANMAPIIFGSMVLFLLVGFPVSFALAANGIFFALVGIELGLLGPQLFQALPDRIFGIMSNDKLQQKPAPGTTPGNSDPQLKQTPPSQRGGN